MTIQPEFDRRAAAAARDDAYGREIYEGLQKSYERTLDRPESLLDLEVDSARIIVFSDLHRGARNDADDFRECEAAYNAALAYYLRLGYQLIVLGDGDELWEERPKAVLKSYPRTFYLEGLFVSANRYLRIWGNHDDEWKYPDSVNELLAPALNASRLAVHEAVRFTCTSNGASLGSLFMVHGHQGTSTSDRHANFSRIVVRHVWRPIQRLFNISLNTPAKDWLLREKHNIAMYRWAERQAKIVLIAGHTHRPVFASESHPAEIREKLEKLEARYRESPTEALRAEISSVAAELEWIQARDRGRKGAEGTVQLAKPCYFNTGCCCFADGDVSGLELAGGFIRLVRWPDDNDRPRPQVLEEARLREVLAAC
jgi:UDP-2,3-diacylglucosamine pyrophosphatase LpxH